MHSLFAVFLRCPSYTHLACQPFDSLELIECAKTERAYCNTVQTAITFCWPADSCSISRTFCYCSFCTYYYSTHYTWWCCVLPRSIIHSSQILHRQSLAGLFVFVFAFAFIVFMLVRLSSLPMVCPSRFSPTLYLHAYLVKNIAIIFSGFNRSNPQL